MKLQQGQLLENAIKVNNAQEFKIKELEQRCQDLEKQLQDKYNHLSGIHSDLETIVDTKCSKNNGYVSLIIGVVALLISLAHFFI